MKTTIIFPNGEIFNIDIKSLKAISKLFSRFCDMMPEQFENSEAFSEASVFCEIIECLEVDQDSCSDKGQEALNHQQHTLVH